VAKEWEVLRKISGHRIKRISQMRTLSSKTNSARISGSTGQSLAVQWAQIPRADTPSINIYEPQNDERFQFLCSCYDTVSLCSPHTPTLFENGANLKD
jgi:hypothetical protein